MYFFIYYYDINTIFFLNVFLCFFTYLIACICIVNNINNLFYKLFKLYI